MDFSDAICNDGIMLEPRLMEYINRKKIYNNNDIETSNSLEKIYAISSDDKKRIKKYLKGKRNLYTRTKLNNDSHFIDPDNHVDGFDNDFKKDPRYKRLKKKMKKQRDAQNQRYNYSDFNHKYESKITKTPYDNLDRDNTSNKFNNYLLDSDDEDEIYNNPNQLFHPERRSNMTYHSQPRISNNRLLNRQIGDNSSSIPYSHDTTKIIGDLDTYSSRVNNRINNRIFDDRSTLDFDSKSVIPKINTNRKRGNYNNYMSVPKMCGNGERNIDMDNYIHYGVNSRASKSIGYKNPVEHYFQYIDSDIQHPDHVVNDRGYPSRLNNKRKARRYKREMRE
jgi:hypothetical protein